MAEYIDKQDAIDIFKQYKKRKWISMPIEQVIEIISVVPYVEVEPVKHAYVIVDEDGNMECSNCGSSNCFDNYCGNCGAKLIGTRKDDEWLDI